VWERPLQRQVHTRKINIKNHNSTRCKLLRNEKANTSFDFPSLKIFHFLFTRSLCLKVAQRFPASGNLKVCLGWTKQSVLLTKLYEEIYALQYASRLKRVKLITSLVQWRTQPKILRGTKYFDFNRATVFCLGHHL